MEKLDAPKDRLGGNGKADEPAMPREMLQKRPWKLLEGKGEYESILRNNLLESLKGAIQLKRRSKYIKEEIAKKRSRRSAAVKRALLAARRDSNNIRESASSLGLEDLWTCLDREIGTGIKTLKRRLETLLELQPNRMLHAPVNTSGKTGNHVAYHSSDENDREKTKASSKRGSADSLDYAYDDVEKQTEDDDDDDDDDDDGDGDDDDDEEASDAAEDIDGIGDNWMDVDDHDNELGDEEIDGSEAYDSDPENVGNKDQSKAKKKEPAGITKDRFFKMEDMEQFAEGNFDDEADDFNYFESMGEESDTSKAAVEMMYGDFFDDPDASDEGSDTDDENDALDCPRGLEGLDEDEKEMELLLQKVEDEEESDEEEENRDDDDLMDFDFNKTEKRVRFEDESSEDENDEISQLEKELVAQKHWSLMGEATGHKRPRNSLLDLDLELPQNSSFIHVENVVADGDDVHDEEKMGPEEAQDVPIEIIIQQRIKAEVFDNVERKIPMEDQLEAIERLKQTRNKMNREETEIDFNKSKMGLGDVYAKRYQEMFMATDQLDTHKQKLTEEFGKLMFKLDSLCNYSIVPKRVSEAEKDNKVASITVEAPINVVTSSRPDDLVDDKIEGHKLTRNAKKRKFTNKLKALLKSGKATVEDVNKIKQKIAERNRQKIQDAKSIKVTGQTKGQLSREKRSNRRVNIAELMSKR